MRIHAITACVNYIDYLRVGVNRWQPHLVSWTLVTDMTDEFTVQFASEYGLSVYRTNAFYDHEAFFNQGAALEEARQHVPWEDWFLLLDADIVPERDWYAKLIDATPQPGMIYGARRYQADTPDRIDRDDLIAETWVMPTGFFQLMHTSDYRVQETPLIETCWRHCGVHDSTLAERWPKHQRACLPISVFHLGPAGPRGHWFGRDKPNPLGDDGNYRDEKYRIMTT